MPDTPSVPPWVSVHGRDAGRAGLVHPGSTRPHHSGWKGPAGAWMWSGAHCESQSQGTVRPGPCQTPTIAPHLAIAGSRQPSSPLAAVCPCLWAVGQQHGCPPLSALRLLTPQGVPACHQPVCHDADTDVPEQQQLRAAGELGLPVPCGGRGGDPAWPSVLPAPPAWHSSPCFLCSFGTTISTWPWLSSLRTPCSWRTSPRPSATASWPSESALPSLDTPCPGCLQAAPQG